MHQGFLYQHLYAVACLFNLRASTDGAVLVEMDEDVEIRAGGQVTFVQVKTRNRPLSNTDIAKTLENFSEIRSRGKIKSDKTMQFAIVSNAEPNENLKTRMASPSWPSDVVFCSPDNPVDVHPIAPPPWRTLKEALQWCVSAASEMPFPGLSPDTLVWKLAARVQFAASGEDSDRPRHRFSRSELPELFEMLVEQLHEFPSVPVDYRPLHDAPDLRTAHGVQLIIGFSGSGKTLWSSWQAQHVSERTAYFDVGDLSGSALTIAMARELAARFVSGRNRGVAPVSGLSGLDALRYISRKIDLTERPIVVVDNVHRVDPEDIRLLVQACPKMRFVLLGRPWPDQGRLAKLLSVDTKHLPGWDVDTVATVFADAGARIGPAGARGWRRVTSGLPLYVRNAAELTVTLCDGDAERLLSSVEQGQHSVELAQEELIEIVVRELTEDEEAVVVAFSLTDVKLGDVQIRRLIGALPYPIRNVDLTLRKLHGKGLMEVYSGGDRKLHDALRVPARAMSGKFSDDEIRALRCELRDIFLESVKKRWDMTTLSAWLRLLPLTGQEEVLVNLASTERFHEFGDPEDLREVLLSVAQSSRGDAELEFLTLDALVFWDLQQGRDIISVDRMVSRLERIIEDHPITSKQRMMTTSKRMIVAGRRGDIETVRTKFAEAMSVCSEDLETLLIVKYNLATALFGAGDIAGSLQVGEDLCDEYFRMMRIDPSEIVGASPSRMKDLSENKWECDQDKLKHLADSLGVVARCRRRLGKDPVWAGFHGVKLYQLCGAYRSQMGAAQDVADDLLEKEDVRGALEIMESCVIPIMNHFQLDGHMVDVRGQYAVILANSGRYEKAVAELDAIEPYIAELPEEHRKAYIRQRKMVEELALERRSECV